VSFTDNQPDFTWLNPYEEKTFTQYFLPYRELGVVKNASKDLLLNIDKQADNLVIKVFATSVTKDVTVVLKSTSGDLIFSETTTLSPESVYLKEVKTGADVNEPELIILDANGTELLAIRSEKAERPLPEPAKAALSPVDTPSCEQLYLTGLHLEQYRHATYNATDYYLEALRRDPSDVRNNNAMGLWLMRRGQFEKAETYFRKAIETQLQRNPNPYDGEPHYNLGLCLQYQAKYKQAYDAFYKSCWNAAMQDAGYMGCAQIFLPEKSID
jgi:tetratricopeptide (TPR) repeat protein